MTLKQLARPSGYVTPTTQPDTPVAYATAAPERTGGLTWCYRPTLYRLSNAEVPTS